MDAPYQAAADVHVLPTNAPFPGVGVLPINAYVLMAEEPVLVDSGLGVDGDGAHAAHEHILADAVVRRGALVAALVATL